MRMRCWLFRKSACVLWISCTLSVVMVYRTGLFGNWVSERFLLVKLLNLQKSKGTERWELSQI